MNKDELENYRNRLLTERERVQGRIDSLGEHGLNASVKETTEELSSYDNHPADLGTETFERSKDLALRDSEIILRNKIDDALARIDAGTYGTCEKCGKPIDPERLQAVPFTTECLTCKREEEKNTRYTRPIEEVALFPPFGRTFLDGTDYTGYDGEDAWQEVARYGTSESPQDVPGQVDFDHLYVDGSEPIGTVEDVEKYDNDALLPGTTDGPHRYQLNHLNLEQQAMVRQRKAEAERRDD